MSPDARKAYFAQHGSMGSTGSGAWATMAHSGSEAQNFSPHLLQPFVSGYKPKGAPDKIQLRRYR